MLSKLVGVPRGARDQGRRHEKPTAPSVIAEGCHLGCSPWGHVHVLLDSLVLCLCICVCVSDVTTFGPVYTRKKEKRSPPLRHPEPASWAVRWFGIFTTPEADKRWGRRGLYVEKRGDTSLGGGSREDGAARPAVSPPAASPEPRFHKTLQSRGARAQFSPSPKRSVLHHRRTEPGSQLRKPGWPCLLERLGPRLPCSPATLTGSTGRPCQGPPALRMQTIDAVMVKHASVRRSPRLPEPVRSRRCPGGD